MKYPSSAIVVKNKVSEALSVVLPYAGIDLKKYGAAGLKGRYLEEKSSYCGLDYAWKANSDP